MPTWAMLSFQDSASPSMSQLLSFHDYVMVVIIMITILVSLNMVMISGIKNYSRLLLQEHVIEILWTIIPIFILLGIGLPSLQALYVLDDPFNTNISLKVMGHQWYWSYEYSDFPDIEFDSYMTNTNGISRLLDTDNSLVLPILSKVRVIGSASDVIHAWTIPALGVKIDVVPGRLNQIMFSISRTGMFFGQCSEICGANHSFMPIKLEAVPMSTFIKWVMSYKIS